VVNLVICSLPDYTGESEMREENENIDSPL